MNLKNFFKSIANCKDFAKVMLLALVCGFIFIMPFIWFIKTNPVAGNLEIILVSFSGIVPMTLAAILLTHIIWRE